jgi:leucyl/phenylalanyl-tRNA--protein transferase
MVLFPSAFHASRSLRKLRRQGHLEVREDSRFVDVMTACAATPRPGQKGSWITPSMIRAYSALHQRGIAHSIEVYSQEELVGGLYGLALGGVFFGESMFYTQRDASKLALWHLCERLATWGFVLIDCQQQTGHLARMGARPIPRTEFLLHLEDAVDVAGRWGRTRSAALLKP